MVFITQFCARIPRSLLVLVALLAGCAPAETGFGFHIKSLDALATPTGINVVVHQKLVLSREARDALDHGVPLAFQIEIAIRPAGDHRDSKREHRSFEIRFLPLSNRYQLTSSQPFSVRTFPRLRHALAELEVVNLSIPASPAPGQETEIRARSFLDKRRMPAPMRLPVWFSSQWQHDSGWQAWPLVLKLHETSTGSRASDQAS